MFRSKQILMPNQARTPNQILFLNRNRSAEHHVRLLKRANRAALPKAMPLIEYALNLVLSSLGKWAPIA